MYPFNPLFVRGVAAEPQAGVLCCVMQHTKSISCYHLVDGIKTTSSSMGYGKVQCNIGCLWFLLQGQNEVIACLGSRNPT